MRSFGGERGLALRPEARKEGFSGRCSLHENLMDGRKEQAQEHSSWKKEDVLFLAQSTVDECRITKAADLQTLDPELHALAAASGVLGELKFVNGKKADGDGMLGLGAEQIRKAHLKGIELCDDATYRLIFADCFRIGTGNPYLGSMRGTIPKLQSNMNRKLSGPQHKLFRRCWERMAAEGVIVYNTNGSAASVDLSGKSLRDPNLASALSWAVSEQAKIGGSVR